jgi:succinate-acetate transporter protein
MKTLDVIEISRTGLIELVTRRNVYTVVCGLVGVVMAADCAYHLYREYRMRQTPAFTMPVSSEITETTGDGR